MKKSNSSNVAATLSPPDMANWLVLSEQELANLTKQGVVKRSSEKTKSGRHRVVYRARATVGAYVLHLRSPAEESRRHFIMEKSLTQQIVRAQKELELAKARGLLVDGEKVDREVMSVLSSIKNHMRALPSRISSLLEGKSKPEIRAIVKKYVDLVLRESGELDLMKLRQPSHQNGKHDKGQRTKTEATARH